MLPVYYRGTLNAADVHFYRHSLIFTMLTVCE